MRPKPCEWCGDAVQPTFVRLVVDRKGWYATEGTFCDPACLRSWLDAEAKPSAKPRKVVAVGQTEQEVKS